MSATWTEEYAGGSAEAERRLFDDLAWEIMQVQLKNKRAASANGVPHGADRAFHAKPTMAVADAELRFRDDLSPELRVGFAQPGATYATVVRFSNAAGTGQPDFAKDLRGVALRITVSPDEHHDLLMTNFPVSHARDAVQFVAFASATATGGAMYTRPTRYSEMTRRNSCRSKRGIVTTVARRCRPWFIITVMP